MANEISIVIRAKSMLAQAFSQAGREVSAFGSRIKSAFSGISGMLSSFGAAISIGAVAAYTKSVLSLADAIDKGSQKLQVSIADYQSLNFAATQSGATMDHVKTAFIKLSTVIKDASDGNKEAVQSLSLVGLSLKELDGKSTADQFRLVARAINEIPDGREKINAFRDLLGKGGVEVAAMVKGLDELEKKFNGLGISIDEGAIAASVRFNDAIDQLKLQLAAASANTGFASKLAEWAEGLNFLTTSSHGARDSVESLLRRYEELGKLIGKGFPTIGFAGQLSGSVANVIASPVGSGPITSTEIQYIKEKSKKMAADKAARDLLRTSALNEKERLEKEKEEKEAAKIKAKKDEEFEKMRESAWQKVSDGMLEQAELQKTANEKDKQKQQEQEKIATEEKKAAQELLDARRDLADAIENEAEDLENKSIFEKAKIAFDKASSLLFKPGTIDENTGIGRLASTKSILDRRRAENMSSRQAIRNQDRLNALYYRAMEKFREGRHLSPREEEEINRRNAKLQMEKNKPQDVVKIAEDQLVALQQIEAKIDKMAGLAARG